VKQIRYIYISVANLKTLNLFQHLCLFQDKSESVFLFDFQDLVCMSKVSPSCYLSERKEIMLSYVKLLLTTACTLYFVCKICTKWMVGIN